jgi:hypothetical protein
MHSAHDHPILEYDTKQCESNNSVENGKMPSLAPISCNSQEH